MDVSRVGGIQGAAPQPPDKSKVAQKPKATSPTDRVEISSKGRPAPEASAPAYVNLAQAALDVRQEKVNDVKEKLAQGIYDTREASRRTAEAIINELSG